MVHCTHVVQPTKWAYNCSSITFTTTNLIRDGVRRSENYITASWGYLVKREKKLVSSVGCKTGNIFNQYSSCSHNYTRPGPAGQHVRCV